MNEELFETEDIPFFKKYLESRIIYDVQKNVYRQKASNTKVILSKLEEFFIILVLRLMKFNDHLKDLKNFNTIF